MSTKTMKEAMKEADKTIKGWNQDELEQYAFDRLTDEIMARASLVDGSQFGKLSDTVSKKRPGFFDMIVNIFGKGA